MNHKAIGFVGGGRLARIFLERWKQAGKVPAQIAVSDPNGETLGKLKQRFPQLATSSDNTQAARQDVVFLAVHPPVIAEVLAGIKGALKPDATLVSLAPKFTVAKLSGMLGGFARIARTIPNAPSLIGQGYNPVAFGPALLEADRAEIIALLSTLGDCPEVPEEKLEAYAVLSAMGPTYLWFQLQALREVAAGFGLSETDIAPALKRMVCGAARTLLESGLTPDEVMDLIPVKPLGEMEAQVSEMYRTRLPGLYQKIKP